MPVLSPSFRKVTLTDANDFSRVLVVTDAYGPRAVARALGATFESDAPASTWVGAPALAIADYTAGSMTVLALQAALRPAELLVNFEDGDQY